MVSPYRLDIKASLNAADVKAGAAEAAAGVNEIGNAASAASPKVDDLSSSIERAANTNVDPATARKITTIGQSADATATRIDQLRAKYDPLHVAQRRHQAELASIAEAERLGAISTSRAIELRAKEISSYQSQIHALSQLAAARKQAAETIVSRRTITPDREADIAAYGAALDRLQASYDPLFAAQQRYLTSVAAITRAERVGAISASLAIDLRIREKNALDAVTNSTIRLDQTRKAMAERIVDRVTITPDRGADIAAYGQQLDQLRARYNPLFAVVTAYKAEVLRIREAHRTGAIGADEMAAALGRERRAALAAMEAIKGRSKAAGGLEPWQKQNLMYQAYDTVQSLALGMPLPMVLMQQGPQVLQIYGSLSAAGKALTAALTPARLAIGGVTTAAVLGAMALNDYLVSTKAVATAATGLGRGVAGTTAEMEAAAEGGAAAANISVSAARAMEVQFLRTGRIGSQNFEKLIGNSRNFAATMGLSADEAGGALAEMFSNPAKAADDLWRKYGLIDGATADYATQLAAQNRLSEAQGVLIDGMSDKLSRASAATTAFGRNWQTTKSILGDTWDFIGKKVDQGLNGLQGQDRIDQIDAALDGGLIVPWMRPGFEAERQKLLDDQASERLRRSEAEREQRGRAAFEIAERSPANAEALQRRELTNQIATLRGGADAERISPFQANANATDLDAKSRALATLLPQEEKARQLAAVDIRLQGELNPLRRAELAGLRARIDLSGQVITTAKVEEKVALARNTALAMEIAGAGGRAGQMQVEAEARKKVNDAVAAGTIGAVEAQRMLSLELEIRPLLSAATDAEIEDKRKLLGTVDRLKAAYAAMAVEEKRSATISYNRAQDDRLKALALEGRMIGATDAERERAMALANAEKQIRDEGLSKDSPRSRQIRNDAAREADMRTGNDSARRRYDLDTDAQLDTIGQSIELERNPLRKADLVGEQERIRALRAGMGAEEAAARATQFRARALKETMTAVAGDVAAMGEEVEIRNRLNAQVANGSITSAEANRILQEELQLRPLIAVAASAEGKEKEELTAQVDALRAAYAGMTAANKDGAALGYLENQQQRIEQLRLEYSLIGQNESVRERSMARLEAEQQIRQMGLDIESERAQQILKNAEAEANLNRQIEKRADAWGKVQQAQEGAMDSLFDKAFDGDIMGGFEDAAKDISKTIFDLSVKNPAVNALTGSERGTIGDIGGFGGLIGKLFGGTADPAELATSALGQTVGSMAVTAGTVIVNGGVGGGTGGIGSLLGANSNATASIGAGQSAGGMAAYRNAISAIESGGNYNALGPLTGGDRAYGKYQVMGNNIPSWSKEALGRSLTPSQFLADPAAQDRIFDHQFGKSVNKFGNPQDAASVWFTGRPLSQGAGARDVLGTSGSEYVDKFNANLGKLGKVSDAATTKIGALTNASSTATEGLGTLGNGLGTMGNNLANAFPAAPTGGSGGGIFDGLLKLFMPQTDFSGSAQAMGIINSGGVGLFADGGGIDKNDPFANAKRPRGRIMGPGGPREDRVPIWASDGEFIVNARSTALFRDELEEINARGVMPSGIRRAMAMADGGAVSDRPAPSYARSRPSPVGQIANGNEAGGRSNSFSAPEKINLVVNNYAGADVQAKETRDSSGNQQIEIQIDAAVGKALSVRGGQTEKGLGAMGVKRRSPERW